MQRQITHWFVFRLENKSFILQNFSVGYVKYDIYINYTENMPFAYFFCKSVKLRQSFQIIWPVIYNTHDLTIRYIGR